MVLGSGPVEQRVGAHVTHGAVRSFRRPSLALGAAFLLVLLAPAAHAAKPRVTKTAKVPLVAAQGDTLSVTATIAGTGVRTKVGLVLGNAKGSAKGGLRLGNGVTIRHRGAKKMVIRGKVPVKTAAGQLRTLLVCIDPAKAVKGKSACKLAAKIATSGRSAEERIGGALKAKRITKAQETLYGLYALSHDPRLPVELRGDTSGPGGDQDAIKDAANSFSTLPAAVQEQVFPYFVPPQAGGSAWQYKGRNWKPSASSGRRATAARRIARATTRSRPAPVRRKTGSPGRECRPRTVRRSSGTARPRRPRSSTTRWRTRPPLRSTRRGCRTSGTS